MLCSCTITQRRRTRLDPICADGKRTKTDFLLVLTLGYRQLEPNRPRRVTKELTMGSPARTPPERRAHRTTTAVLRGRGRCPLSRTLCRWPGCANAPGAC